MINFNGILQEKQQLFSNNRAFSYGDALFETIKVVNGKLLFWEDHYFRLMASMRIMRMEIPMAFTMEFLSAEIEKLLTTQSLEKGASRVKITVFRDSEGLYAPKVNTVAYVIEAVVLKEQMYQHTGDTYVVDLFKDHYVAPQLLSTLKSTNRILNVIASVFAKENDFDNCLLLNTNKQVIEAINGNLFLVSGKTIKTPPITDGCINGIMRKQLLLILADFEGYTIEEASISPFELQKADELFISNAISGITSITAYRKKKYNSAVASQLTTLLNSKQIG